MIEDQKQPELKTEQLEENSELSENQEQIDSLNQETMTVASESSPQAETTTAQNTNAEATVSDFAFSEIKPEEFQAIITALQQEIVTLKQQLDDQVQQVDLFKGQYVRIAADFDNFRKRTQKEKEDLDYQVKKNTINELLATVDSFERARTQIKPQNDGEMAIHKSYQGVYKQLVDALKRIGVSAMRPEGEEFDPNFHEAIYQEQTDEYPEGTVIEQVVRGYLLGDRVLRHAMVKVAAPKEDVITSEEETTADSNNTDSSVS